MREMRQRKLGILAFALLMLTGLACDILGISLSANQDKNDVRRAALSYELDRRGPVDELLVSFQSSEPRDNLGFSGGNTVWLHSAAENEYFNQRDANRSYLFLYDLQREGDTASISAERGGPSGFSVRRLTLRQEGGRWQVVSDVPLSHR